MPSPDPLLVFVCAHNACRSAIAEVIAAEEARRLGLSLQVASAGTNALPGYGAASIAQATISEIGLSLERHRSQRTSEDLLSRASLVVTMSDEQRDTLHAEFPRYRANVVSFNDITGLGDVPDPIGGQSEEVRAIRVLLQFSMPPIFQALEERSRTKL